ncbi:Replication factor C subunit 1 [Merluccius polli]|uniref:Replication factor C subunit 1 n=1 Tax=Merluccius polli TaxID=89951 RepID=A0AA47P6P5_MERPO|nr:Replication factor C subunit 1 [Merluccius polli]
MLTSDRSVVLIFSQSTDIRRFFAPTSAKPAVQKTDGHGKPGKEEKKPKSSDEDKKNSEEEKEEEEEIKEKKASKEKPKSSKAERSPKTDPVQYVSETGKYSDGDNFLSLKITSKPKENETKKPTKKTADKSSRGSKESTKSPVKQPASQGKIPTKSPPPVPRTPKSMAPPQPKLTPTSVLDFFGSASVQRSNKKLVASTKRKAPSQDQDDLMNDERIAKQLQMDEDMELERQVHEDEDFARTLAMLDDQPHAKKARKESPSLAEKRGTSASPSASTSKNSEEDHTTEDVISPSPQKPSAPIRASSKLAMMKKKEEKGEANIKEEKSRMTISPVKSKISPKKEPVASSSADRKSTPKVGSVAAVTTPTALKTSPKEPESIEDAEKKKGNSAGYRNYLNRDGPRALGSKDIPKGGENCLEGCVFVLTGVLESMERDDAKSMIERYGGKVTGNVSKKTTYLVLGRDSGASKTEKAENFGTTILDEDGLLELIRTKPGKKSKYEIAAEAENKVSKSRTPTSQPSKSTPKAQKISPSKGNSRSPQTPSPSKTGQRAAGRAGTSTTPPGRGTASQVRRGLGLTTPPSSSSSPAPDKEAASLLWVDKYRPLSLKAVIGQQGDQSCANKLVRWLKNWHRHHAGGGAKPPVAKFTKFGGGGKDDGSSFKAALLSGPPGVGKTTTAALVCEELGYTYVEMNASCTRSKNHLKDVIAESLNNTSIKNFYAGTSQTVSSKHVLIMDEVDGMAGNEDRGGIQEMIGLIKSSKIPIICMCNDRNHQKIRSLANYCFDLRFQRPRVEQIKGAMMSIAFKEGLKIPAPALNEIILASNHDVRQVLHNLCMWSAKEKVMTYDQCKSDAASARKDLKLGPFDVCRKVFSKGEETSNMSFIDKSDLFFHDYSLAPLFVQENYVHVRPAAAGGNLKAHLVLLSKTADSICDGDLVDRQIRSKQTWSLLPTQAIYASVLPGELMKGYMNQFPTFPSWLGKFSSTNKHARIIQDLASHMSLRTWSSKQAVNLDYLPYLRGALLSPLQRQGAEGAGQAVQLLDDYQLIKEDVDSMMEISVWGGQPDPYSKLDSKIYETVSMSSPQVKAAFTRAYNREVHLTPYSLQAVKKGRRGGGGAGGEGELAGEEMDSQGPAAAEEEEEEEENLLDGMIKQKKAKAKAAKETKKVKAEDSGKGKGRGKAKAKAKK